MKITNTTAINFNNKTTAKKDSKKISFGSDSILITTKKSTKKEQSPNILSSIFQNAVTKYRLHKLKKLGVSDFLARRISLLDNNAYKKALCLIYLGAEPICAEEISNFEDEQYKQALELIQDNITDENLPPIAALNEDKYAQAKDLRQKGIDTDCIKLFTDLSSEEFQKAEKYLKQGYPPIEAGYLAQLTDEQAKTALDLLKQGISIENAADIAVLNPEQQEKCQNLITKGINEYEILPLSSLEGETQARIDELLKLNAGDSNIEFIAKLDEKSYKRALDLLNEGVLPEYITDIIAIEQGKSKNPEYEEYRKRGYSYSSSYALSLLDSKETKALIKLIKNNPDIKKLFKSNYDITLIKLQNSEKAEAILSREIRTKNGTLITLVQTFDEDGNHTKSRLEEYSNHATSSTLSQNSDVFKVKYDKNGEIREMTQFIQSPDTKEVTGIINTKASEILHGAFESTYYDISDFKTSSSNDNNEIDTDTDKAVCSNGKTISKVTKAPDGTITYIEHFTVNNCIVQREYKEKRDSDGNIIYSSYHYKITNQKNGETKMDINREFKRNKDGSITNTINGITYHITFDDTNKTITISDGQKTKKINMGNKLSFYSAEVQWEVIKKLPADILLAADKYVKKWNYCRETDSAADGYSGILSAGRQTNIIQHETGHFLDYENETISENEEFMKIYSKEMAAFQKKIPYNEQEFIQYFSPRADLNDANGSSEFIAESNIILTTYGNEYPRLSTRPWLLSRFFPNSIAKAAELLGKNSKSSLIE